MNSQREEAIFDAVLELPASQRESYLAKACYDDAALRQRIEALLLGHERTGVLDQSNASALKKSIVRSTPLTEKPGDRIGNHKLLQQIGEGGCGIVWMAEQERPVRRRVALKVIKLGMDTKQVVARFEAERQALALMDHPNIAKVLDAGATETGRPFFVMELVRGVRITEYCDQHNLPTPQRLELFTQVCQAVQHAHQKGIIHRDIKPSNILIADHDGVPVPKVIDFGIAKATSDQQLTDKTLFTAFEQFIGTPAYMSPEQANLSGLDIDTRTDIYSLGVLLYELLTGKTPFDAKELHQAGLDEMRRAIREEEPSCPSTRLSTMQAADLTATARHRHTEAPKLVLLVRGDLDWIVMKCLEKDRARRYETANGIAADVRRHLGNEPILARPPSQVYRFRKLVRRNRTTFAAVVAVVIALVAGLTASIWQAIRAHRGEARAQAALADLRATAPAYAAQARGLAANGQFTEAIEKLDYAIQLRPDIPEYLISKANLLEGQLRFTNAAPVYHAALQLAPASARVQTNLFLCEQLGSPDLAKTPRWDELLAALYVVMVAEQRSEVELRLIAGLVLDYSRKRLAASPIFAGHSLGERLRLPLGTWLHLDLRGTAIVDLDPLQGLPLHNVNMAGTAVTDLRPLRGLPLTTLGISGTKVIDLEPLRGMQTLTSLSMHDSAVTDLSPIQGLPITWLDVNGTRVKDLSPLRGMPMEVLRLRNTLVVDLTPLAGMPLYELDCTSTPATDFSALANSPDLKHLFLSNTAIKDLGLVQRCKLVHLRIDNTAIRDLAPLGGMPLQTIRFHDTEVTDVAPLLQCPSLQSIGFSRNARNVALLRALPELRRISSSRDSRGDPAQTATEFWTALDRQIEDRK